MRLISIFLRPVYYLLYHQFAWTYDFVASIVSLGHWQDWVQVALPYLNGRILEIGFGPGHLQRYMNEKQHLAFGLDESRQMAHQASRLLRKQGAMVRLARGYAQNIPFASGVFESVVATFPAEFIFYPRTLQELRRVLAPSGKLIILPMAWITSMRPLIRLTTWLFRVSGEAPGMPRPVSAALRDQFVCAGFEIRSKIVVRKDSQVLVLVAENDHVPDLE